MIPNAPGPPRHPRKGAGALPVLALVLGALALVTVVFLARPTPGPGEGMRPERPDRIEEAAGVHVPAVLPDPLPGLSGVRDAVEDADGWWLLDARTHQVHRVGPALEPRFVVGRRGEGPGEFRAARALAIRGDSLIVLDQGQHPALQAIGPDGGFGPRTTLETGACLTFSPSGLAIEPSGRVLVSGFCARSTPPAGVGWVVIAFEDDGTSGIVFGEVGPPDLQQAAFRSLAIASGPGGSWAGDARDPCLHPLPPPNAGRMGEGPGDEPEPPGPLSCLRPWVALPFPHEDFARGVPGGVVPAEIREATRELEWLPVLDRIFHHPRGLVLRRLQGLESRSLVLMDPAGEWRTLDSRLPESVFVGRTAYLVAWDGPMAVHPELRPLPR
jgi:hypothetical protein